MFVQKISKFNVDEIDYRLHSLEPLECHVLFEWPLIIPPLYEHNPFSSSQGLNVL